MKYPITASITLVQTDAEADVYAYVGYGYAGDKAHAIRQEINLGPLPDAVDLQMWMQMAAASVCDAI